MAPGSRPWVSYWPIFHGERGEECANFNSFSWSARQSTKEYSRLGWPLLPKWLKACSWGLAWQESGTQLGVLPTTELQGIASANAVDSRRLYLSKIVDDILRRLKLLIGSPGVSAEVRTCGFWLQVEELLGWLLR